MLKQLLVTQETESVNKYVENLDATPLSNYSLWKATKNLNKPNNTHAFDKVWHESLLSKIKQSLPTNTHKLLEIYLIHRKFVHKEGNYIR